MTPTPRRSPARRLVRRWWSDGDDHTRAADWEDDGRRNASPTRSQADEIPQARDAGHAAGRARPDQPIG